MERLKSFINERSKTREGKASIIFYNLFTVANRIEASLNKNE